MYVRIAVKIVITIDEPRIGIVTRLTIVQLTLLIIGVKNEVVGRAICIVSSYFNGVKSVNSEALRSLVPNL
jgi:hypothetical protein